MANHSTGRIFEVVDNDGDALVFERRPNGKGLRAVMNGGDVVLVDMHDVIALKNYLENVLYSTHPREEGRPHG